MIEIPRHYTSPTISAGSPNKNVRFTSIADEDKPITFVERRLAPTRRHPDLSQARPKIERRVSSDRRRSSFSSKA